MSSSSTEIPDLLQRIRGVPELRPIFTKLWEPGNDNYRRFFFTHRDLLFASIDEKPWPLILPFFYVGSAPSPSENVLVAVGESRAAQREFLTETTEKKVEEFASDAKTTASFLALRYIIRNPALAALVSAVEPSWGAVAKAVATTPPTFDVFDEFVTKGDALPKGDQVLRDTVGRYVSAVKDFTRKGDFMKFAAAIDLSNMLLPFYGVCRAHLAQLLPARQLDEQAYYGIVQELYLKRLVTNTGTTFWCGSCQDDPVILTSQSRISVEKLGLACPKCSQPMFVASLYEPHVLIRDACSSKDGMLGVAIAWLLAKHGIKYDPQSFVGDKELDFRFTIGSRNVLLECKMFKTHKDDEAIENHLAGALGQAVKHVDEIRAKSEQVDETWIVTNHELDLVDAPLSRALSRHAKNLETRGIEFVDASDLPGRLTAGAK